MTGKEKLKSEKNSSKKSSFLFPLIHLKKKPSLSPVDPGASLPFAKIVFFRQWERKTEAIGSENPGEKRKNKRTTIEGEKKKKNARKSERNHNL